MQLFAITQLTSKFGHFLHQSLFIFPLPLLVPPCVVLSPQLNLWIHRPGIHPLAICLAPTRELAKQVEKEFVDSSRLDTLCVYGGTPIQQQMRVLSQGVDVVVGTPGRVIDLLNRRALNLSNVQFVVLDEADQMLSVGFDEAVEEILQNVPAKRQTLMFSATMPPWIRKLMQKYLKDPVIVDLVSDAYPCFTEHCNYDFIAKFVYTYLTLFVMHLLFRLAFNLSLEVTSILLCSLVGSDFCCFVASKISISVSMKMHIKKIILAV